MATAEDVLLPLRPGLVPVPAGGEEGVCRFCHSGCEPQYRQCYPCRQADRTVGAIDILPVAMSVEGEMLHHHLRGYKDEHSAEVRTRMARRLAALTAVFLRHHAGCVGAFDSVVAVPSPSRTAIEPILQFVPELRDAYRPALASTGVGSKADLRVDRFTLTRDVAGEHLLLIDDTFASGASLFSAAAALRAGGATVVCALVLGRHVKTIWEPSRQLLSWLRPRSWDDSRCCRCDGERVSSIQALW
jgi:hypothetical protein